MTNSDHNISWYWLINWNSQLAVSFCKWFCTNYCESMTRVRCFCDCSQIRRKMKVRMLTWYWKLIHLRSLAIVWIWRWWKSFTFVWSISELGWRESWWIRSYWQFLMLWLCHFTHYCFKSTLRRFGNDLTCCSFVEVSKNIFHLVYLFPRRLGLSFQRCQQFFHSFN